MLNVTIQSHPIKDGWYKPNEKCWIVATINPISHSCPVHHSKFSMFLLINVVAVITEKSSSLHTIILETKHKQSNTLSKTTIEYIFLQKEIRYFILLAINTHIDCVNNSKSVFGAFSKQQPGVLKVCCASFSIIPVPPMDMDSPHLSLTKHTMIYLSMLVLGMINQNGQHRQKKTCL